MRAFASSLVATSLSSCILSASAFATTFDLRAYEIDDLYDGGTSMALSQDGIGAVLVANVDSFTVSFIHGNGFSFDEFTVRAANSIPEPSAALLFLAFGVLTLSVGTRHRSS